MIRTFFISLLLALCSVLSFAQSIPTIVQGQIQSQTNMSDGLHKVFLSKKEFVVCIKNQEIESIKRVVFQEGTRECLNAYLVDLIEEAYAAHLLRIDNPRFEDIIILEGEWSLLENLKKDMCEVTITYQDGIFLYMSISHQKEIFSIRCPIDYQLFNRGSRTEMENTFIEALLHFDIDTVRTTPNFNLSDLTRIDDNLYVLKGEYHIIQSINCNLYLSVYDDEMQIIVNPEQPIATISNMINFGIGYETQVNMIISRHEYGEFTTIKVPLEQLLQFCMLNGCQVFWGVEQYKDELLTGSIFCYNEKQGYEHIFRIECNTSDLGLESFTMNARVSLYVPTTNLKGYFTNN